MSDNTKAYVSEDKFNATATLTVEGVDTAEEAKVVAKQFFRDEYGHTPSRIVAEEAYYIDEPQWTVMVADHSSGSLKDSSEYEW
jgi:hypothetical protein